MKVAKVIFVLIAAIYGAINLYVYMNQQGLMYFPTTDRVTPEQVGLHDVDEVVLQTNSNLELTSWYGRAEPGQATILFFHGNGGAINHRVQRFRDLMAEGYGVFVLGYPGYGGNAGEPSETAFLEAARLSHKYLRGSGLAEENIVIYGESIGSGVAVQLAASVEASGLVLEAPMSSMVDVAREHYPFFLVGFLLKDSYKSVDYVERIDMPLLVIHGSDDRIIPIALGRKLFEHANDPKTFVEFEGARHNDLHAFSALENALTFMESIKNTRQIEQTH